MNKRIRQLVKALRFTQGERDAALGVKPVKSTTNYIKGYAQQHCRDKTWSSSL